MIYDEDIAVDALLEDGYYDESQDYNDYVDEEGINYAFYDEASDPSQKGLNPTSIVDFGKDHSVGAGDSAETSKLNIPALLAAKTAGGDPHDFTLKNGISNHFSSNTLKVKL